MRRVGSAFGALTVRGRGFLTSGITSVLCGLVLLERDLVRVGALVAALPLVALVVVLLRRPRLSVERDVRPPEVSVGDTGSVTMTVTNHGRGAGVLLVQEQVPYALGARPRFSLPRLERDHGVELTYALEPDQRGRYRLGPLEARHREPFGMVEIRREIAGTRDVLVLPRVIALPAISLAGDGHASGDERPRAYSTGTVADAVVRTYRRGDDLRRVHWPTSARVGQLMVRNEEQLWQPRATVLLDDREASHRGRGAGSSLESAVTVAASVVAHLVDHGYLVRLVTGDGTLESEAGAGPRALLAHLAELGASRAASLPDVPVNDDLVGSVVVAVLGAPVGDAETVERVHRWWARFPLVAGAALALALDTPTWGQRGTEPLIGSTGPTWLQQQGWRTVGLGKGTDLPVAWEGLTR